MVKKSAQLTSNSLQSKKSQVLNFIGSEIIIIFIEKLTTIYFSWMEVIFQEYNIDADTLLTTFMSDSSKVQQSVNSVHLEITLPLW